MNQNNFGKKKRKSVVPHTKIIKGTFMFTDIVGSSKLWKKYKQRMYTALKKHESLIYRIVKKEKGVVVKTIGDAFMIFFPGKNSYLPAIRTASQIQHFLINTPICLGKTKKDTIKLRIGMCYGKANEANVMYQGKRLKDYFGATVNIASRMESKVAKPNDFAISFNAKKIKEIQKLEYVKKFFLSKCKSKWKIYVRMYKRNCKVPKKKNRSWRIIQGYRCFKEEKLHGVGSVRAYLFSLV